MNRKVLLILAGLAVAVAGAALAERNWLSGVRPAAGPVGKLPDAPQVTLKDLQGNDVTLEQLDRKSTRLNSSHIQKSRMPSSA